MNDTRQMRANTGNRIAFGVLILLVSLFVFICTCGAFGGVGEMVSSVFVGFFGLADYAYSLVGMAIAVAVIFNFRIKATPSKILKLSLMFVLGIWALNIYSSSGHMAGNGYGEYLLASYHGANTAGGMLYGIISYPLMRVITTVGALVVVCAAFFVMAFIALMPTIKKDVTYVAADATRREKPRRGSRMDRQKAPAITDFSSQEGGGSLYVVDVEGDPLSRSKRKTKARRAMTLSIPMREHITRTSCALANAFRRAQTVFPPAALQGTFCSVPLPKRTVFPITGR